MNKLKTQRKKRGLSQNDLATKLNVARSTVTCWETNRSAPRLVMLKKISRVLKCKLEDLI